MVAAQVFLGLWATGLAVAAPQLDFGDSRTVKVSQETYQENINQNQVVSDVVSALQPSIEAAIAEALASLRSSSVSSNTDSTFSSGNSGLSATGGAAAVVEQPAQYNYEYKVADEEAQNYISKSESRDGDTLTGKYSYVDPNGDLITVNYEAGPMGYSAVSEKQEGFVSIRKQNSGLSSASGSSSAFSGFSGATSGVSSTTTTSSSSSSSSFDKSDLIARIIASLQPQITSAVQSALASSSTSSGYVRETNRATDLSGTFGSGVSVNIDTPEYNINY